MRVGIDLGGMTVKFALCAADGTILRKLSVPTQNGNADGLRADMKAAVLQLCAQQGVSPEQIETIGIGVPGSLDKQSRTMEKGTNLGMNHVCFADTFLPEFTCPVYLENDANCAALGEAIGGAARHARNVIMLTLGTGVGGGIVIDGRLYTGSNDLAGELGHMVICAGGEPCNCGRRGCLEAYCSAMHLIQFAERALESGRASSLQASRGQVTGKMICDAVDAGDPLATELFATYCDHLACGIANYINIFQPDSIVLGGGLANYGEKLLQPLRERLENQYFRGKTNTQLVLAVLGNDAGMVGAAMLGA